MPFSGLAASLRRGGLQFSKNSRATELGETLPPSQDFRVRLLNWDGLSLKTCDADIVATCGNLENPAFLLVIWLGKLCHVLLEVTKAILQWRNCGQTLRCMCYESIG